MPILRALTFRRDLAWAMCLVSVGCTESQPVATPKGNTSRTISDAAAGDSQSKAARPARISTAPPQPGSIHFSDVTEPSGITFEHTDGGGGTLYIIQTVVAGLALLDYDNDGWIDIYFLNGAANPGVHFDTPPRNELYRNNGDWTFTNVTESAGVGDMGYGLGVVAGDYDGDGDHDIYVNNFGPNVLYRNNGDGTFTDVTKSAGVASDGCGAGAAFLDIEADGDLDLYVANYVDFSYENNKTDSLGGLEFSAGPSSYNPQPDVLFRNNGDGTFTDISRESGIASAPGPSMGLVCADLDDDFDTDIFICSDYAANQLFQNDGAGNFKDVAFVAGVAYDLEGNSNGSMGVTCEDYDNDGRLDLYVTTFSDELSILYRNMGQGFFTDMSRPSLSSASTLPHVKWGTTLSDFDHDGDRDLFVACGHFWIDPRYASERTAVRVPNALLENQGDGTFRDVSRTSGNGLDIVASSKGAAFDDLDNDGDLDAVVLNANGKPSILRNDTLTGRKSVQIVLRGHRSNRDGVGARIKVVAGGREQISEVHRGQGYQSHYGNRLHFGLGAATKPSRIEVRWLGGKVDVIDNPPEAPFLLIAEGGRCEALTFGPQPESRSNGMRLSVESE